MKLLSLLGMAYILLFGGTAFGQSCENDSQCSSQAECLPRFGPNKTCQTPAPIKFDHDYEDIDGEGEVLAACENDSQCNNGLKCLLLDGTQMRCYQPCLTEGTFCNDYRGPGTAVCRKPRRVGAPDFIVNPGPLCMVICGGSELICTFSPLRERCEGICPNGSSCEAVSDPNLTAMRCK